MGPVVALAPRVRSRMSLPQPLGAPREPEVDLGPGGPTPRLRALLDVLGGLHVHAASPGAEVWLAERLEHLLVGGAVAVFQCESGHVLRRGAGPRWRTAEREPPANVTLEDSGLALLVRTGMPLRGQMASAAHVLPIEGALELIHLPIAVRGAWWGALVVLRPAQPNGRSEDLWIAHTCASHLGILLGRLGEQTLGGRVIDDLHHHLTGIVDSLGTALAAAPADGPLKGEIEAALIASLQALAYVEQLGEPEPLA